MSRKIAKKPRNSIKKAPASNGAATLGDINGSMYFNERDFQNFGKFVPYMVHYGEALQDADVRVSKQQRLDLVDQSRTYAANLPEVAAAMQRLADFTVGTAVVPQFNGANQEWARIINKNYLDKVLSNLTRLGVAVDWQTLWQMVLKIVLTDGDILMIPYVDRYGLPHLDFIEGHRIASRDNSKLVKGGRFDGAQCEDGIIYVNGNLAGFQILGDTVEDDYTIAKANCYLITSPFTFKKPRGLPALSAASRACRNALDYSHYIPQIIKVEAQVQLVETNTDGKAPAGRTAFAAYNAGASNSQTVPVDAVREYLQAGVRYLKTNGGKLESFHSTRPTKEVQQYVTQNQKELLSPIFPHQLLLSPETIGGPGARGLKEILVASINTYRAMIEKYALIALQYVLSVGSVNTTLQETFDFTSNYKEDFLDWSFSKVPEPCLDLGAERSADLADLAAGIKSAPELVAKEGKTYDDVLKQISEANEKKGAAIIAFQNRFPQLAEFAPQMFGLEQLKPVTSSPAPPQP